MKRFHLILAALLVSTFVVGDVTAGKKNKGKKHKVPPGLAKKGGVPPGLAKKGKLPPGLAKKYAVGHRLPKNKYRPVETKYFKHLPYKAPEGRKWVRVGNDLYLLGTATATIADVVEKWLD